MRGIPVSRQVRVICAAALLPALAACAEDAARPRDAVYTVFRMRTEPILDGRLTEAAWAELPEVFGFLVTRKDRDPLQFTVLDRQTSFRVGWSADALFVGLHCEEPSMDAAVKRAYRKDGGPLWNDNSIELFLCPTGAESYVQFIVNLVAARWSSRSGHVEQMPGWRAAAAQTDTAFVLEIMIPFAVLGGAPKDGQAWEANICRNTRHRPGHRHTSWAPTTARTGFAGNFGRFVFKDAVLSASRAAAAQRELNASYRAYAAEQLNAIAAAYPQIEKVLRQTRTTPELRRQADVLLTRWQRVLALSEARDIPRGFASMRGLVRESRELRGQMLLESLFTDRE